MHKQYAITFKSPSYALNEGAEGKTVLVELVKPSDESTSEPMEFTFLPRGQTTQQPPAAVSANPPRPTHICNQQVSAANIIIIHLFDAGIVVVQQEQRHC